MKQKWSVILTAALGSALLLCACARGEQPQKSTSFTYWRNSEIDVTGTPFDNELERRTGVQLEYIYPHHGNIQEQMKLFFLSNNLPDIIETDWSNMEGGAGNAIQKGYILPLDNLIEGHAPNLKRYLDEHPELEKSIRSEAGYYVFPFIRSDESLKVYSGLCLRSDWLAKAGLSLPETMDDWHTVLQTFRDRFRCATPVAITPDCRAFLYAYRIAGDFYISDGEIACRYLRPEYKEYLRTMHQWYEEGLLGVDYPNSVYGYTEEMLADGSCGAFYGTAGRTIGNALKMGIPVEAAPVPVLRRGERPFASDYDVAVTGEGAASISTDCSDPETAARFLDFGYSEEGMLFYNFGVPEESYIIADGKPLYTKMITENPNISQIMNQYLRANNSGPFIQMKEYMEQYAHSPQQKTALERWQDTDAAEHALPNLQLTQEESTELSQLQFLGYAQDMEMNFILGITELSEYDAYLERLSELGIYRALEIYQGAYRRYREH